MPHYTEEAFSTPVGRNVFLRSTRNVKTLSRTVARDTVPARTIDGHAGQKVLQPGTVLATITAVGANQGKVGPFQAEATDGRQTTANIVGICNSPLFWELMHRDVEVAVVYEAAVVQGLCRELNAAGAEIALTNTTATAMTNQKHLDIRFVN